MTNWRRDVYKDSEWLHHWDIEGSSPVTVTIESYAHKDAFNPGTKEKGVLWALSFKGAQKALGINVTNGELIEQHLGEDRNAWIGQQVTLRTAVCKGEKCIRVDAMKGAKLPAKCPRFEYTDGGS